MDVGFRPLARADFDTLGRWLREPLIAWWWSDDPSPAAIEATYGPAIDGHESTDVCIVTIDGNDAGLIQRYRIADEAEYVDELAPLVDLPDGVMSIDYLLSQDAAGGGRGTAVIGAFVARLWDDHPACPCIVVPVHADNRRSWRALERCGFARVAEGDLTPDNPAHSPRHVIYRLDRPAAD